MIDREIEIPTADGMMNSFVTHPEEGGPHPVVFFYMDAPGKREELHDMARRLGTAGYYVVLPNMYYRLVREFDATPDFALHAKELWEYMYSLTIDKVATDTQAMFEHIAADPAADESSVGAVGYCMSGPYAYAMAGTFPDRIKAAASFYGVRLSGDGSPDHLTARVSGELYFGCAEHDDFAPAEMVHALEAHLQQSGVNARVEWYPGVHHGFAFPSRQGAYDKAAAERHWERLHALFDRTLR
ncbi:MAG: dienelactone hydrolase [Acidimicrobiia bacterium]|nr:dienelactone hydrolase [Acidimicrobiia bacterium]